MRMILIGCQSTCYFQRENSNFTVENVGGYHLKQVFSVNLITLGKPASHTS